MIASPQIPLALIGDVGGGELLVILAAILMLFGGRKLPSIARTLGRTVEDLRKASEDFRNQLLNADRDIARNLDPDAHPESGTPPVDGSEGEPIVPKRLPPSARPTTPNPDISRPAPPAPPASPS